MISAVFQMLIFIVIYLSFFIATMNTIAIPFINNTVFVAESNSSSIRISNHTCVQCLCISNFSSMVLNCFPNSTCEFFTTVPSSYQIQIFPQARLYFPQQIFPNASQCCTSNIGCLIQRVNAATPIIASVLAPRCLAIDDYGYIVGISGTNKSVIRLYPNNLTVVSYPVPPILGSGPSTLAYYDGAYYIGFYSSVSVMLSSNLTIIGSMTAPALALIRDMTFVNGGRTMIVVATAPSFLYFFQRSSNAVRNFTFAYKQLANYINPHGLFYINDTFFYATSWHDNTIYSYSNPSSNGTWTEALVMDVSPTTNASDGNHITIDAYGRTWFSLGQFGLRVYSSQGVWLGSISMPTGSSIFDARVTEDYVIYYSDSQLNRIVRIAPDVSCWNFSSTKELEFSSRPLTLRWTATWIYTIFFK